MSGLQFSGYEAHFSAKELVSGIFCLKLDATVQRQGEGAWDIRTAKTFEAL